MRRRSAGYSDLRGELVNVPANARRGCRAEVADEPVNRGTAGDFLVRGRLRRAERDVCLLVPSPLEEPPARGFGYVPAT